MLHSTLLSEKSTLATALVTQFDLLVFNDSVVDNGTLNDLLRASMLCLWTLTKSGY
jgi:hypothetical protein